MKYKLIVSDLDGTLLNGQKFVSNINKDAIRKAKEQGMSFAIPVEGRCIRFSPSSSNGKWRSLWIMYSV